MFKRLLLLLVSVLLIYIIWPSKSLDKNNVTQAKISELISNPLDFQNHLVKISGKALVSFCLLTGYYFISDNENRLVLIKPKNNLPADGETVKITGKIHKLVQVDNVQFIVIEEI
jgi:hypothetical protein